MSAVVIQGVAPWDGRYDFEDFGLTNHELYRLKVVSGGIRAGELLDALEANDTAAYVGFAVAIMERHGHKVDPEQLWNAPVGSITIDLGDAVADPPTQPSSSDDSPENEPSSGDGSSEGGV